nr:TetR/AcrR family transcriptional regulator [Breoghania corrubedonensis]
MAAPGDGVPPVVDNAKRRQILEGARAVFRAKGFDGASMEVIAKKANVSKGTLYVYFDSKEALFEALILADRHRQAEALMDVEADRIEDFAEDLRRLGRTYVRLMTSPDKVAMLRMVIGAAERFPQFGQMLYEAGPVSGAARLGHYLEKRIASGDLKPCDTMLAASHFFELCVARLMKRLLFGVSSTPNDEEIEKTVDLGVKVFLAAYGAQKS